MEFKSFQPAELKRVGTIDTNREGLTLKSDRETLASDWDDFVDLELMSIYQETNRMIKLQLQDIKREIQQAKADGDEILLSNLLSEEGQLELLKVEAEANYPGDWTLLLGKRMRDSATREKFIQVRKEAMKQMKTGIPGFGDEPDEFMDHYQGQIDTYDQRINQIFSQTESYSASDSRMKPTNLGMGKIGEPGVVFNDAQRLVDQELVNLTSRQKNIIEAHEKGHGLRDFTANSDAQELRLALDHDQVDRELEKLRRETGINAPPRSIKRAEEIAERMAQLKNYFGMKGDEQFTEKHLAHARNHYVSDTGLDNSMSTFLSAITPEKEQEFIRVINKYPL